MKDVEQRTWEVVKRAFEERSPSRRSRAGNTVLLAALLAGVYERVRLLGGHCRIESRPGGPSEIAAYGLVDDVPVGYWERWSAKVVERVCEQVKRRAVKP